MKEHYDSVINADVNPLKDLPRVQKYKTMLLLGTMWTIGFCAIASAWLWFGHILLAHIILASCFLVTGSSFEHARKITTYRDYPRKDGSGPEPITRHPPGTKIPNNGIFECNVDSDFLLSSRRVGLVRRTFDRTRRGRSRFRSDRLDIPDC